MNPWELFNKILNTSYKTVGDGLDYSVDYESASNTIYIIFQESSGAVDWRTNLNFLPKSEVNEERKRLLFHGGYYRAYTSGSFYILCDFYNLYVEHPSATINIIGWSYGGGVAPLCAIDLHKYFKINANITTFGAPAVCFNKSTVNSLKTYCGEVSEYAHVNDLVPLLPLGYKHINKISVGSGKAFYKIFNPNKYHCLYGDESIY